MKRLVFLDIHGVEANSWSTAIAETPFAPYDPNCVAALNLIIDRTGAEIVASTSERHDLADPIESLTRLFALNGVHGRIVGFTPYLRDLTQIRGMEIQMWLEQNGIPDSFVILDDKPDMGPLLPRLVQTKSDIGLTREDAERAIELLLAT